jgi:hypothetical protein
LDHAKQYLGEKVKEIKIERKVKGLSKKKKFLKISRY